MEKKGSGFWWSLVKYLLFAYVITTIILMGLAFLLWKNNPPTSLISAGMIFAYVISSFTGGLLLGKKMQKNRYLWGPLFGGIYFGVVLLLSAALSNVSGETFGNAVTVCMLCLGGGMLGGMLG